MGGEVGQYLRNVDGHSQRVQCMVLVQTSSSTGTSSSTSTSDHPHHTQVWSGSNNGTILVHDSTVIIHPSNQSLFNQSFNQSFIQSNSQEPIIQLLLCILLYSAILLHLLVYSVLLYIKTGELLSRIQAPGKGLEEDYICCLLYVNGNVWCGGSDGTIHIFQSQVTLYGREKKGENEIIIIKTIVY